MCCTICLDIIIFKLPVFSLFSSAICRRISVTALLRCNNLICSLYAFYLHLSLVRLPCSSFFYCRIIIAVAGEMTRYILENKLLLFSVRSFLCPHIFEYIWTHTQTGERHRNRYKSHLIFFLDVDDDTDGGDDNHDHALELRLIFSNLRAHSSLFFLYANASTAFICAL